VRQYGPWAMWDFFLSILLHQKLVGMGKKWIKGRASFPVIILFAATPLPDDIVGIVCGIFNYNIKKFLLASFIGKLIMNTALAWGGFYGFKWMSTIFGSTITWLLVGIGIIGFILFNFLTPKIKKKR